MLVKRELWDQLNGFDPAFFMYAEDADFCLRAAALGYHPMVTARAVCQHEGGVSSSSERKLVLLFTGKATLVRRHFPRGLRTAGIGLLVTGVLLRAAASKVIGSASSARQQRPTTRGEDWRALWSARAEWRRGWGRATPPA
jgi:GT2 family glycosyltransferase